MGKINLQSKEPNIVLAKVLNPSFSLSQIGSLVGVDKVLVHRILKRQGELVTKLSNCQRSLSVEIDKDLFINELARVNSKVNESTAELEARFDEFWKIYPRKIAKKAAMKAYKKATKDKAKPEDILLGAEKVRKDYDNGKIELQYIPHPTTWLNQGRWEDLTEEDMKSPVIEEEQPDVEDAGAWATNYFLKK